MGKKGNSLFKKIDINNVKEKITAGKDKVNEHIKDLAFIGILEKKILSETRAKFPVLDNLILLTNYKVCGLALMIVVSVIGNIACGSGGGKSNPSENITAQGDNFSDKLQWLSAYGKTSGSYIIEGDANDSIGPRTFIGKVTITIRSVGENRTLSLSSIRGTMFTIESGATLFLENISIYGSIRVNSGGTLILNEGSDVGTVYVYNGTFTMNGGTVSGGRGVIMSGGTFNMSDGTIHYNDNSEPGGSGGGGVSMSGGRFNMSGGTISDNISTFNHGGGGVFISGGRFNMSGGTISNNSALGLGGGVYVSGGTFTMSGGTISGNTARDGGGGVYVSKGTFTKTGGTITGYTSDTDNGNVVKSNGAIQNYRGHAVSVPGRKIRETTADISDNLSWNALTAKGAWDN